MTERMRYSIHNDDEQMISQRPNLDSAIELAQQYANRRQARYYVYDGNRLMRTLYPASP